MSKMKKTQVSKPSKKTKIRAQTIILEVKKKEKIGTEKAKLKTKEHLALRTFSGS